MDRCSDGETEILPWGKRRWKEGGEKDRGGGEREEGEKEEVVKGSRGKRKRRWKREGEEEEEVKDGPGPVMVSDTHCPTVHI